MRSVHPFDPSVSVLLVFPEVTTNSKQDSQGAELSFAGGSEAVEHSFYM